MFHVGVEIDNKKHLAENRLQHYIYMEGKSSRNTQIDTNLRMLDRDLDLNYNTL